MNASRFPVLEVVHAARELLGEVLVVGAQVLVGVVALRDQLQVAKHLTLHHLDGVLP